MFPSLACSLPADAIRRTAKLENSIGDFPDEIKPPHGFTLYKIISAAGAYAAQGYAASLSQPQRLFLKSVVTAVPPYPSSEIKKEAYSCLKHSCGILFNCGGPYLACKKPTFFITLFNVRWAIAVAFCAFSR